MNFIIKHYCILIIFLLFIIFKCIFVIFWFKPYPNVQSQLQEMRIIGMPSYEKLSTLKLLEDNSGLGKLLSFSGFLSVQSQKNLSQITPNIDCLDILNDNNAIKMMYKSELGVQIFKNVTINSLKLLQDLDKKKVKLKNGLALLLKENFIQFESIATEKAYALQVCTLDESINQYLSSIKKDPEKQQSRVKIRQCFINTNNCNLSFMKDYWLSEKKIFYFYIKFVQITKFEYEGRSVLNKISNPIDYLTKNRNFTTQFLDLLDKCNLEPVNLTSNSYLKSEYDKKIIISNVSILFWSWLIITLFSVFFFHTILLLLISCILNLTTILFSYICYYYLYIYLRSNSSSASVFNITSLVALYLIILNDSFIVSICYSLSRKLIFNSKAHVTDVATKITNNTFRQSFYYIVPKNLAFLFIFFVSYLNQIEIIQKFCLFLIILLINYMIFGFSFYSLTILFLSSYHQKFWYKHQIKICDIDLNDTIKKLFSDYIPFMITRLRLFLVLVFIGLSLLSQFFIFYYPKFTIDKKFTITDGDFRISIIWGSKIQHYDQDVNALLNVDMENHAYEQFSQMKKLCDYLKTFSQPVWIKEPNCFSLSLADFFLNSSISKNLEQIETLAYSKKKLSEPMFKQLEIECMLKSLELTESLFNKCIKWWSLKVLEYEANRGKKFKSSPLFLPNRLVPSLYFIQLDTNIAIDNIDFENFQSALNSIELWWKNLVIQFKLNENFIWWTSKQMENYLFQKKAQQQILLTYLVSLIILLAISIYSCSKLITSLCVYISIICSLSNISALLLFLDFKINLYNINLFILQIILASQYSIFKGVSLRYSPHVDQHNCIVWSFSNVGLSILVYCLLSSLGSLPLLFSSVKFYSSLGKVVFSSNIISYLYSTLFLPSLLSLTSRRICEDILAKFKRNRRTNEHVRYSIGRHASSSSFAPSIVFSHARTISTCLESDVIDIGEYRRRTLSRCSTGWNSHRNSIFGSYSNAGRNSLSNQNPNYLQIPRVNRNSVRRISSQSRRSSIMHSRRNSNLMARRNSRKLLNADSQIQFETKSSSNLSIPSVTYHASN